VLLIFQPKEREGNKMTKKSLVVLAAMVLVYSFALMTPAMADDYDDLIKMGKDLVNVF